MTTLIKRISKKALLFLALSLLCSQVVTAQQILPPALFVGSPAAADTGSQLTTGANQPKNTSNPQMSVPITTSPQDPLYVVTSAQQGKMFGSQLFGGTFRGTLNQGFNADYVIAIGDRLQVRMWGAFSYEGNLIVDPQGNVYIPNVGPIAVAGVQSGEINTVMERGIRKTYKSNTEIYAALDASQPVKVYVTGYVQQPGLYGGVSSDSPISFLDKAGGVDQERGSYVDIVIKRGAQIRKQINLYNFLIDGTLDLAQFQDGDVIVVGSRKHSFSVNGEVFNDYDFEFVEDSIPLKNALAMAKIKSGATHVSIIRRQGAEKRSEYFPLSEMGNVTINDGDSISLSADRSQGTIQVRIEGAHSSEHALILPYGSKLKEVLDRIKPNTMSRLEAIQLYRKSVQTRQKEMLTIALQKIEESALSARSKTTEEATLRSKEAELIMRFVERAKQVKPKGQVVLDETQKADTLLEDGDIIVVPERTSLVIVHGEVLFPNAVSWQKRNSVEDYIKQAGGLTQGADTSKVVLIQQNGATLLAENSSEVEAGDEIMVLPRIETKSYEVTRALTQILYQIAFTAKVAFGF